MTSSSRTAVVGFSAHADRERYALFSYTGDHTVKFVAEITAYEPISNKRAITGPRARLPPRSLPPLGRGAGAGQLPQPGYVLQGARGNPSNCACGCGEAVPANRAFVPGHDQRAIHARITEQWGGTLGFIDWLDATYRDRR